MARKAASSERKTTPKEIREIVGLLEAQYGVPEWEPRFSPMDELVSCILSQHTSDANSFPAFYRLKERFPTWQEVVAAGPEAVANVVRSAGLANQKARSIVACLNAIRQRNGGYSIDNLKGTPLREARKWLEELPGVGPKTASIVLCFSFGLGAIPVDTHIYRVAWRLGLIPEGIGEAKAHDRLLEVVPEDLAFRFHVALIRHGRAVCKAPLPKCEQCAVAESCWWFSVGGPDSKRAEMKSRNRRKPKR